MKKLLILVAFAMLLVSCANPNADDYSIVSETKPTGTTVEDYTGYTRITSMSKEHIDSNLSYYGGNKGISYVFYPKGFDYKTAPSFDSTYLKLKYVKTIKYELTEEDTSRGFAYGIMYKYANSTYTPITEIDVYEVYVDDSKAPSRGFVLQGNNLKWYLTADRKEIYKFFFEKVEGKWVACTCQYYDKAYPELAD
ncbi:hypothetical protein [Treponema sp. C6A8]|uniref:hypothetical protein n=1 Tax=Treponema sp. C6A8 TaxID=1410609 RepID=UPI000485DE6A|nr:hypothetical protein [Treponema sp. C6A8]